MTSVVPRPDGRRPLGGTIAVLTLVILATLALRGTLPTIAPAISESRPDNSAAAWIGLITLLSASLLITAVALLTRSSGRSTAVVEDDRWVGTGAGSWSTSRVVLFVLGAVALWLLIVLLLNQWRHLGGPPAPGDVPVSAPSSPAKATPESPGETVTPRGDEEVLGYLAASVMALAMLTVAGAVVAARRRRRPNQNAASEDDPEDLVEETASPGHLVAAAESGLIAIEDLSREPREAIIACYAAMEHALAGAPGAAPLDSDTPSEVLYRAVSSHAVPADSAATLVQLFAEARFSTHVMTEEHREAAERALRTVLGELRSAS